MTHLARPKKSGLARAAVAAVALTTLSLSLVACGSDSGADDSSSASDDSTMSAELEALTKPVDSYDLPSESLDASSLAGETIYYIPITSQSPQFAVTQAALKNALDAVDISLQVCDGKATPTDVSACVTQATEAKAGAIITDAIPYALAANAFDDAQAAGIPIVNTNQLASDDYPASDTLAYIEASGSAMQEALAEWVIADSDGSGQVLINQGTDGPAPAVFVAAGQKVYDDSCDGCKVTVNEVSSANFSLITPSTSAALVKDPSITYVVSQFEQYLQPTEAGVQQTSRTDIKGLTGSVQLSGLKALASGDFLYAAAGQASAFSGWADADVAMRLMLGMDVPTYTIPVRLFTRDTIDDVTLTDAAEASGEWYGPTTFPEDFEKLWGVK
ncbi:substrate-binding domain-containing protein [Nocardioides sp. GY 10127]|uniref:sugar ABC transporter substrate-binding protein n=1 Tax=Nocardioides sp. GY 10127 TaxID=2569762 RepID=UPI0010A76A11|nr:substrate-binding domain-containing protein [Nocardioides sp. GY 10127]TIC79305.1 sugar ABC transporter substrate-binding protein [Nocardioides sp. GY 10127]